MADFVQQNLERMLPELEEMVRIRLFTKSETRAILRKRKAHEYRLCRRSKEKADYLQYIQYEVNVLALVRKRRNKFDIQHKKNEIDLAIVTRINHLFRMACHRFQDDVNLWLSHIEFAKKRGEKSTVSRLFLRMLQVLPKKPELWIMSAQWEFEVHKSTENSRSIFQRGLRFNPESQALWLEYYRMELLHVDKLRRRREILGVDEMDTEETIDQGVAILEGKVAEAVFQNAVEKFPNDAEFCWSFVEVCGLFDFSKPLIDKMMEILKEKFTDDSYYWHMLAQQEGGQFLKEKKCGLEAVWNLECAKAKVYEEACAKLKSEDIWTLYLKYWLNRCGKKSSDKLRQMRQEKCLSAFADCEKEDCLSKDMKMKRLEFIFKAHRQDFLPRCMQLIEDFPKDVDVISLCLQLLSQASHPVDAIVDIFKCSIKKLNPKDTVALWETMLSSLSAEHHDHVTSLLQLGLTSSSDEVKLLCKSVYLDYTIISEGIKAVRKVFKKLSCTPPISKEFVRKYIKSEMLEEKPKVQLIREAFELLVDRFGRSDVDVWMEYLQYVASQNSSMSASEAVKTSELYWKAKNALEPSLVEEFVEKYSVLTTS